MVSLAAASSNDVDFVVLPPNQTSDDLGDLVESHRGLPAKVERVQRAGVGVRRVAEGHFFSRVISVVRCLGCHRVRGAAGISVTLPPLARLRRRGRWVVASAVEIL